jgi:hypothetical protein
MLAVAFGGLTIADGIADLEGVGRAELPVNGR